MPHDRCAPQILTSAERRRRHRMAYPLSLELGITPAEAEAELDRRAAVSLHRHSTRALAARMTAPQLQPLVDPEPPRSPWWQQD